MYCRRIGTKIWAIEIIRGDRISRTTVKEMVNVMSAESQNSAGVFCARGHLTSILFLTVRKNGIAVIAKLSDEYETLVFLVRLVPRLISS